VLKAGNWKPETGSWKLETEAGNWKLETGSWELIIDG
jgi:hypothetical protein